MNLHVYVEFQVTMRVKLHMSLLVSSPSAIIQHVTGTFKPPGGARGHALSDDKDNFPRLDLRQAVPSTTTL